MNNQTQIQEIKEIFDTQKKQIEIVREFYTIVLPDGQHCYKKSLLDVVNEICDLQNKIWPINDYYVSYVIDQLQNNNLPEMSSGSFITALSCYEWIIDNDNYQDVDIETINTLAKEYNL